MRIATWGTVFSVIILGAGLLCDADQYAACPVGYTVLDQPLGNGWGLDGVSIAPRATHRYCAVLDRSVNIVTFSEQWRGTRCENIHLTVIPPMRSGLPLQQSQAADASMLTLRPSTSDPHGTIPLGTYLIHVINEDDGSACPGSQYMVSWWWTQTDEPEPPPPNPETLCPDGILDQPFGTQGDLFKGRGHVQAAPIGQSKIFCAFVPAPHPWRLEFTTYDETDSGCGYVSLTVRQHPSTGGPSWVRTTEASPSPSVMVWSTVDGSAYTLPGLYLMEMTTSPLHNPACNTFKVYWSAQ